MYGFVFPKKAKRYTTDDFYSAIIDVNYF